MKKDFEFDDKYKLKRSRAYQGKIGQLRERFCINYINHKNEVIEEINELQIETTKNAVQFITCKKSCTYSSCCLEYVDATIQECEAIVYYLYNNLEKLRLFEKKYQLWKEDIKKIEHIVNECEEYSFNFIEYSRSANYSSAQNTFGQLGVSYYDQIRLSKKLF